MTKRAWPVELESYVVQRFREGASVNEIQRELGGTKLTISRTLKRHGCQPIIGSRKWCFSDEQLGLIRSMWESGSPVTHICRRFNSTEGRIKRELRGMGFDPQPRIAKGPEHHLWRGGSKTTGGYWKVLVYPDDPMQEMRDVKGYVLEHRLVMARSLGRPLRSNESVHHINGKRDDNRIENLQLRQSVHGKGVVACCNSCGSQDISFNGLD